MDSLSICHVNAQSLPAHFMEFKNFFINNTYDIIAVTETWFHQNLGNNLFSLDNHILFRNDRGRYRGGGVCLYIRKGLECSLVAMSSEGVYPTAEYLFIKIQSPYDNILVGVVYKPPNASFGTDLEDEIFGLIPNFNNVVVMGDFNCDLNISSSITNYLTSMVYSAGLSLVPHNSTHHLLHSITKIDAMFVTGLERVLERGQHAVSFLSSHDLIYKI